VFSPRILPVVTTQKEDRKHEVGSEELSTFLVTEVTHQQSPKAKKILKDPPVLAEPIAASIIEGNKLYCNYSSSFAPVPAA